MRRAWLVALLLLNLGVGVYAVQNGEVTMIIVRAEEKKRDRVVAWVNDTPIDQQDP